MNLIVVNCWPMIADLWHAQKIKKKSHLISRKCWSTKGLWEFYAIYLLFSWCKCVLFWLYRPMSPSAEGLFRILSKHMYQNLRPRRYLQASLFPGMLRSTLKLLIFHRRCFLEFTLLNVLSINQTRNIYPNFMLQL